MRRPLCPSVPSRLAVLLLLAPIAGMGCASSGGDLTARPAAYGSATPEMAIQRFFEGVKAEDYQQMGRQFGTREGPAEKRFGISEVEKRMMVLTGLLQHEDYSMEEADLAQVGPHRTRYLVTLTGTSQGRVELPVITVTTSEDRWFVEQVVVDPITRGAVR